MNLPGLLLESLRAAVPVWREEFAHMHSDQLRDYINQHKRGDILNVCARGDILMYGGGGKGEAAEVFNSLARGLAALSLQPGGVTFAGMHWCQNHEQCLTGPDPIAPVVDLPHHKDAAEQYERDLGNDKYGRKTTASYFTNEDLIECLLETSLDPVIDQALKNSRERLARNRRLITDTIRRIDTARSIPKKYTGPDGSGSPADVPSPPPTQPLTLFGGATA